MQGTVVHQDKTDNFIVFVGLLALVLLFASFVAFLFYYGPKSQPDNCTSHTTSLNCDNYNNRIHRQR